MPRGSTMYKMGGQKRTVVCHHCDKQFSGNIRTVNKLLKLHTEKNHNVKAVLPSKYDKLMMDTNKNLNWGGTDAMDRKNHTTMTVDFDTSITEYSVQK